jgi:5-methyltetrahydrofolate--homocysteine methyltransferase
MEKDLLLTAQERIIYFDGAMGTMLMASGLDRGQIPELWNLENQEVVAGIHEKYYQAGSDVVHTNTFGGSTVKLAEKGYAEEMANINKAAADLARKVCPAGKWVAGDIGPTGKMLKPLGELSAEEAEQIFFKQARALLEGGVDLISIETMFSLEEARAAVRGAKRAADVPVIASMTFNQTPRGFFTTMGEDVKRCAELLENDGVDVVASNCSLISRDMIDLTKEMRAVTQKPLLIQPNAGSPVIRDGGTVYDQSATEFAMDIKAIVEAGANMVGGCCGTNDDFIREAVKLTAQSAE